ncbi:MAG: type II and III secretion system protein [Bryobacteraceae bacterium]|nr:type II and III secretion system protein [Bryobacteraceae bacterium]
MRFAVLIAVSAGLLAGGPAMRVARDAAKAARSGDFLNAYFLYSEALRLDPANTQLRRDRAAALQKVQSRVAGAVNASPVPSQPPSKPEWAAVTGSITPAELQEAQTAEPPPELAFAPLEKSFELSGNAKDIWESVGKTFGIEIFFDPDYQPPPPVRLYTPEANGPVTFRILEEISNSFVAPVSSRRAMVVRDLPQKRIALQPVAVRLIPIPERIAIQEAQEMASLVQQSLEVRRLTVDPMKRLILVRDAVMKVHAATQLLSDLSQPRAQVHLEAQLLSVRKSSSLTFGFQWQSLFPVYYLGDWLNNVVSVPNTARLILLGGGQSLLGVGITSIAAVAQATESDAVAMLQTDLVAADGTPATLTLGDRYPIVTSLFVGAPEGVVAPPTINFEDLGFTLKFTPQVHGPDEVSIEFEVESKALGEFTANGVPAIQNRKFQSKVRLRTDEAAIVSGLFGSQRFRTTEAIPFLSRLPLLGKLFQRRVSSTQDNEILLVLRPRVKVAPPSERPVRGVWLGTETRLRTIY